ncbi:hypothetical protein IMSAG249_02072 [Lachnospiraceae bacterium]|nr:hypothetical protein IMSAG249_02072 [Lachnospiraceae bacterium]
MKKNVYILWFEWWKVLKKLGISRVLRWCYYVKLIILVEFGNDLK